MTRTLFLLSLWTAALPALAGAAAEEPAGLNRAALVIRSGSVAMRQVVALGRDVHVEGEARTDVAAVNGSVRVSGRIGGDLIALGGDAFLEPGSTVEGDIFVLGGRIVAAGGSTVYGRSVAYPTVSSAWLVLMEGPALGHPAFSPVVVGAKLALLAAWLAWSLLVFATNGREVLAASAAVQERPFHNFFVGLTGILAASLSAVFASALAAAMVGLPLLALLVLIAMILKLWGLVAVFHALGHWLTTGMVRRRLTPLNAALCGLIALGAVKFVPWLGAWTWTVATCIGVGAALTTKLGRREPWFEGVLVPPS
jgi:hypothetical protein